jgi:hypothetical protein
MNETHQLQPNVEGKKNSDYGYKHIESQQS